MVQHIASTSAISVKMVAWQKDFVIYKILDILLNVDFGI